MRLDKTPRVAFVQDGSRLHYAVPLALQRAGHLEKMFTDWFVRGAWWEQAAVGIASRGVPFAGRRARERYCPELDDARVVRNIWKPIQSYLRQNRFDSREAYYKWVSGRMGRWISNQDLRGANLLYGFIRNLDPVMCRFFRRRGMRVVGDQIIAPAAVERREIERQQARWPGWREGVDTSSLRLVEVIEKKTWRSLNHLTCASEYVRDGLIKQGVASERISVLPYPNSSISSFPRHFRTTPKSSFTVGFVGSVGLRKGAPIFLEVARRFDSQSTRFVMVGPCVVAREKRTELESRVHLVGSVARSEVESWLHRFDIFFFPSTCEGSAGAVMEALAAGLPVVTTPNSGTVVRHDREGFIHDCDDIEGFVRSIRFLRDAYNRRQEMAAAARHRAAQFNLDAYSRELSRVLTSVLNSYTSAQPPLI